MDEKRGNADDSFEERLRDARRRQGLDTPPSGSGKPDTLGTSALATALRVGVELVAALITGVAIGWALDRWLHTTPFLLIVFMLLGGVAGVLNVWRIYAPPSGPDKRSWPRR